MPRRTPSLKNRPASVHDRRVVNNWKSYRMGRSGFTMNIGEANILLVREIVQDLRRQGFTIRPARDAKKTLFIQPK